MCPKLPHFWCIPASPHICPHLLESLSVAEHVHFVDRIVSNFLGSPLPILFREKRVLTEVLCKQMKDLLSMRSWAEDIFWAFGWKLHFSNIQSGPSSASCSLVSLSKYSLTHVSSSPYLSSPSSESSNSGSLSESNTGWFSDAAKKAPEESVGCLTGIGTTLWTIPFRHIIRCGPWGVLRLWPIQALQPWSDTVSIW